MYISGTCLKGLPSVCTSSIAVFPDPLPPTPSISSSVKTPENTEKDPDDSEPADGVTCIF